MCVTIRMKAENRRFERKFRIEHIVPEAVRQTLRMLPWDLRTLYPDRCISNIYFDTPNLDTYRENAFGIAERRKFRLRWYGECSWPEGQAVFEIKERSLEQGNKRSFFIEAGDLGDMGSLLARLRTLDGVPSSLQPVLINSYTRSYFGDAAGKFRITIDRDQRFRGLFFHTQRHIPAVGPGTWVSDPAVILELKYDAEWDEEIDPILQNLPFRFSKNSKYVQGVELLYL